MAFMKKNTAAGAADNMWRKLNIFYNGGFSFTNDTKAIYLGSGPIHKSVVSTTPVSTITHNLYPADMIKITISGQITVNETTTINWEGKRAYVDGIGTGNYSPATITIGSQVFTGSGWSTFEQGTQYSIQIVDYISNPGKLLSNLPVGATYMTAAKPVIGLIQSVVVSYVNGITGKNGILCLGRA